MGQPPAGKSQLEKHNERWMLDCQCLRCGLTADLALHFDKTGIRLISASSGHSKGSNRLRALSYT
jgi:hypothetical protein